MSYDHLMIIIS